MGIPLQHNADPDDPEKFAAMIKAQAEAEATETTEATEVAEEDGVDKQ